MTTSEELWNDHRTASTNAVAILRRLEAEGHLNPTAAQSVRKQLRILDGIAVAIGEASVREARALPIRTADDIFHGREADALVPASARERARRLNNGESL